MKTKKCEYCKKKIDKKETHVDLITYNSGKVKENKSWHIFCWGEFNQEMVNKRISQMANVGMNMIKNLGEIP